MNADISSVEKIAEFISMTGFPVMAWLLYYFDFRKVIKNMTETNNEMVKTNQKLLELFTKAISIESVDVGE